MFVAKLWNKKRISCNSDKIRKKANALWKSTLAAGKVDVFTIPANQRARLHFKKTNTLAFSQLLAFGDFYLLHRLTTEYFILRLASNLASLMTTSPCKDSQEAIYL